MSEASRQRWLHVTNRLAELRAKYGLEEAATPDWLDTIEGLQALQARLAAEAPGEPIQGPAEIQAAKETAETPPPQNRVVERSQGKRRQGADW